MAPEQSGSEPKGSETGPSEPGLAKICQSLTKTCQRTAKGLPELARGRPRARRILRGGKSGEDGSERL